MQAPLRHPSRQPVELAEQPSSRPSGQPVFAPAAPPGRGVEESELDKSGHAIRDMFAAVAPRYDLLNRLLSATLDRVWRRRAAAVLGEADKHRVLDLCCGTGDQATALHRRGAAVAAADFCVPMLALARPKFHASRRGSTPRPVPLAADALTLPFAAGSFTAATVSFGLRNVADLDRALTELATVLAPGGRLVILEFAIPEPRWLRALYLFYFRRVLPRIGALLSPRGSAYGYLPASVLDFPQRQGFLDRMAAAGLTELAWKDLSGGIVCLYTARKPRSQPGRPPQ